MEPVTALLCVFPTSCAFFWLLYAWLWPLLLPICSTRYLTLSHPSRCSVRQNLVAWVHAVVVVLWIAAGMWGSTLSITTPRNISLYSAFCFSLGYFCFAVPWTLWWMRRPDGEGMTSQPLLVHHLLVLLCLVVLMAKDVCSMYGGLGFVLFELSNWFYCPHLMMTTLGLRGCSFYLVSAAFFLTFLVCRLPLAGYATLHYTTELCVLGLSPPRASYGLAWGGLFAFWFMWLLSIYWFRLVCTGAMEMWREFLEERRQRERVRQISVSSNKRKQELLDSLRQKREEGQKAAGQGIDMQSNYPSGV